MAIPCNAILYRAVLKKSWFDRDNPSLVQPEAFFRRAPEEKDGVRLAKDEDGLSLFLADKISAEECRAEFKTCFGVVSLHVGTLLDLGITIVADAQDDRKVLATNLPFENPLNADEEKLAGDAAKTARVVLRSLHI